MTDIDSRLSPDRVLATDEDLHEVFELLLRRANLRQMWLIMFDEQSRVAGPLMPLDDYPRDPDGEFATEDLGRVSNAEVLAVRSRMIVEMVGARSIALIWERRGAEEFTPGDLAWGRAIARECAAAGVLLRAQFVLHDTGLRMLTPDDYA